MTFIEAAKIRFQCSKCGQSIAAEPADAGRSACCPTCNNSLLIPGPTPGSAPTPQEDAHRPDPARGLDLASLQVQLSEAHRGRHEAAHALDAAKEEMAVLQQKIRQALEERDRLACTSAETKELRAALENVRTQSAAQEKIGADLRNQLADAFEVISGLRAERATLETAHKETTAEAERDRERSSTVEAQLRASLGAARGEIEIATAERVTLRSALEATQKAALTAEASATDQLAGMHRALTASESNGNVLSDRVKTLEATLKTLRADLARENSGRDLLALRDQVRELQETLEQRAASLVQSAEEVTALKTEKADLRRQLSEALLRGADFERKAEAVSDRELLKDNELLRGIVTRQRQAADKQGAELFVLRSARLLLRMIQIVGTFLVLGLAALALDALPEPVKQLLRQWLGVQ
jgi:DNA repair exonuclease SbcCD ATPase subunit